MSPRFPMGERRQSGPCGLWFLRNSPYGSNPLQGARANLPRCRHKPGAPPKGLRRGMRPGRSDRVFAAWEKMDARLLHSIATSPNRSAYGAAAYAFESVPAPKFCFHSRGESCRGIRALYTSSLRLRETREGAVATATGRQWGIVAATGGMPARREVGIFARHRVCPTVGRHADRHDGGTKETHCHADK